MTKKVTSINQSGGITVGEINYKESENKIQSMNKKNTLIEKIYYFFGIIGVIAVILYYIYG